MQSCTGAAFTALVVNVPAIGDSTSEKMSARSFLPGFFIAASVTEKKKPFGVFMDGNLFISLGYMGSMTVFNCYRILTASGKDRMILEPDGVVKRSEGRARKK
jgi:hypothetical protein